MFPRQQRDRLQEHPEVGPLSFLHLPVHGEEHCSGCAEEFEVACEPHEPRRLVLARYAELGVHLFAHGEASRFVRFGQFRRIDVVFGAFAAWRRRHFFAHAVDDLLPNRILHHIGAPGLQISSRGRALRAAQNLLERGAGYRLGREGPAGTSSFESF